MQARAVKQNCSAGAALLMKSDACTHAGNAHMPHSFVRTCVHAGPRSKLHGLSCTWPLCGKIIATLATCVGCFIIIITRKALSSTTRHNGTDGRIYTCGKGIQSSSSSSSSSSSTSCAPNRRHHHRDLGYNSTH
eukprot:1609202-Pleurochrysis_carterae.AAC.1